MVQARGRLLQQLGSDLLCGVPALRLRVEHAHKHLRAIAGQAPALHQRQGGTVLGGMHGEVELVGVLNSALGDRVFPAALTNTPVQLFGNLDLPHSYIGDVAHGLATLGAAEAGWDRFGCCRLRHPSPSARWRA